MVQNVSNPVVIQQEYEEWRGVLTVPRALELLGLPMTKRAVAARFRKKNGRPITTAGLDKAIARYEREHSQPPPEPAGV